MNKENLKTNKIYRLDTGYSYELIKITKICENHIKAYRLEYPSERIGIKNENLIYIKTMPIAEISEINAINAQGLPKINKEDINDMLIDLNIKKGKIKNVKKIRRTIITQ